MCWCNPQIRTPFCGSPACHPPTQSPPPPDSVKVPDSIPKLAEVKTIYKDNARLIPEMLRKLADNVENFNSERPSIDQAVCIIRDSSTGKLNIYGWGDTSIDNSISMVSQALRRLSNIADAGDLWDIPRT